MLFVISKLKLMKNKASQYESKFNGIEEMYILPTKLNSETLESINNLWRSDCEKVEAKSVDIWKRTQEGLDHY